MLYLANPSKQTVVFNYREPRANLLAAVEIASGRQVELGHDWNPQETVKVIEQIHRFGGRPSTEVMRNMGKFLGLLYREDKPVEAADIHAAHDRVVDTQERRSAAEATKAALGYDRNAQANGKGKRVAKTTGVEVEELVAPYDRPRAGAVHMNMEVDPEGRVDTNLPV